MRLAMQSERARRNEKLFSQGKLFRSLNLSVQEVFRLGTIQGARAIRMEDQLGSIEVGKLADLVIFDARSPGMICASEQDPVAAIVLHSSIRDIDTVIVNGRICKRNGSLVPVEINPHLPGVNILKQKVDWAQVAQELLSSRERIENVIKKAGADDLEHQVSSTLPMFYESVTKFV
jgi:cytosine/adenosine deaminase-related metal-dependent hydrolase